MPSSVYPLNMVTGLVLLSSLVLTRGFHMNTGPRLFYQRSKALHNSNLFGPEEYDDGIGNTNSNADQDDGQALAKDFYEQLRQREQAGEKEVNTTSESTTKSDTQYDNSPTMPAEDARFSNRQLFTPRRQEGVAGGDDQAPKTKFTGQQSAPGRISSNSNVSTGSSRRSSPREDMMEREFQLVGRAEKNIGFQAAFAVVALAFYIYIGLSGGIVTGEASSSENFGGDDDIPFEKLMPVQRDSETSVWL